MIEHGDKLQELAKLLKLDQKPAQKQPKRKRAA
jgi:hypothetical protein